MELENSFQEIEENVPEDTLLVFSKEVGRFELKHNYNYNLLINFILEMDFSLSKINYTGN